MIAELAGAQHGVVGHEQIIDAGLGRGALEHRVRTGRLHRLHRGVYAVGHLLLTREGRWTAAVLACGPEAWLSHASGTALWGVSAHRPGPVDVTVPNRSGRRPGPAITIHRPRTLLPEEVTRHRGIPVTTVARTLLDLGGVRPAADVQRAVEQAERMKLLELASLRAVLLAHPGHHGHGVLSDVLGRDWIVSEPTRNDLEQSFLRLCDRHGLPRPLVNTHVGPYEVDFLWPDARLIAETDGRETHGTRAAFERDRARDAQLMVAGYRVVRFTYRQVTDDPEAVATVLRSLLLLPTSAAR